MDKRALIVLSAARSADFPGRSGVFASSFIAAYQTLSQAGFQVVVATPNSVAPELRCEDDNAAKWVRERKQLFMAGLARLCGSSSLQRNRLSQLGMVLQGYSVRWIRLQAAGCFAITS
eukprot:TRINITY_DN5999_c0_g1_i1.p1 TRINITY_DN5999_c0_g1~~TRINITY_DN5999_c0_g1_i1.p1  ORF type:complete len:118 (-),score=10.32 TRINITY_DN5999_c0_g1_i1:146-499(-)